MTTQAVVRQGGPADEIVREAKHASAELVVMGRRRPELRRSKRTPSLLRSPTLGKRGRADAAPWRQARRPFTR
jgi:nucleotide-binding universal stress UspA family protein